MLTVYTKDRCLQCQVVKARLKELNISFVEKHIGFDITVEELTTLIGERPRTAPVVVDKDNNQVSTTIFIDHNFDYEKYQDE